MNPSHPPPVPSLVKLPFREEEKTVSLSVMTEKHIAFTPIPFHRGKNNSRDHKIINPKAILQPSSSVSPKMCPQNPSMHCAVNGCQGRDPIVKFGVKEAQTAFFTSGFLSISDASMCARSPQDPERMQVITCARPPPSPTVRLLPPVFPLKVSLFLSLVSPLPGSAASPMTYPVSSAFFFWPETN